MLSLVSAPLDHDPVARRKLRKFAAASSRSDFACDRSLRRPEARFQSEGRKPMADHIQNLMVLKSDVLQWWPFSLSKADKAGGNEKWVKDRWVRAEINVTNLISIGCRLGS